MRRAACLLLPLFAVGCTHVEVVPPPKVQLYSGPLASQQEVINRLAAGNAEVRTLWSRFDFGLAYRDKKGNPDEHSGTGVLTLRKPALGTDAPIDISLRGSKDALGEVFAVGANQERAWLILRGKIDTMYWLPQGSNAKIDPALLPARPDLVADVLGLSDIPTDLTTPPVPVMRYDAETDCYILTFVEAATDVPDRYITRREIYVGRVDYRPHEVRLFAPDGRIAVRSELKNWAPLASSTAQVPTDITLHFPLSRSTFRLVLRDPLASRNGFPKDISFVFPDEPGVGNIERLDAPPPARQ